MRQLRQAVPNRLLRESYLRGYDGDYRLSGLEEQAFTAARRPPLFDRAPVADATADDLDLGLTAAFISTSRDRDPYGLGRFDNDSELLTEVRWRARWMRSTWSGATCRWR